MEASLLLLLFLAHLLADFIFQPQKWSDEKQQKVFSKYHLLHAAVVGITSFALSFSFSFWWAAILLTVVHLAIDILKSWFQSKADKSDYFFLDQLLHLVSIIATVFLYERHVQISFPFELSLKTIAIITGFIFCTKPSNVLIKYVFAAFSINAPKNDEGHYSLPNAGKLIGILERFLVLALILLGKYEAVGLIIAAKSLLRFNDAKNSEYVLVGTLLSFSIATFTGILINFIP